MCGRSRVPHFLRCLRRGRPLTPAVPALIVGLQDADKLGHAGSIPIDHNRNLSIGRGPAPLPEPDQEIGDAYHGGLSATMEVNSNHWQHAAR
jgi:hypothetical protein